MQLRIHESKLVPEKHWHRHHNSCKQVEKSILSVIPEMSQLVSRIPDLSWLISGILDFGWPGGWDAWNKQVFWRNLPSIYLIFFVSRHSLWTWHGYFEKKLDLACFFWQYRQLKQKSAAPQGSPPPTQQIKIQMQISWVGRSTKSTSDEGCIVAYCLYYTL